MPNINADDVPVNRAPLDRSTTPLGTDPLFLSKLSSEETSLAARPRRSDNLWHRASPAMNGLTRPWQSWVEHGGPNFVRDRTDRLPPTAIFKGLPSVARRAAIIGHARSTKDRLAAPPSPLWLKHDYLDVFSVPPPRAGAGTDDLHRRLCEVSRHQ